MNVLLDVILVSIFLLIVIISARRGFIKCIWSLVTVVSAFFLAYTFGPMLGAKLCDRFIYDYVSSYTYESVEKMAQKDADDYDLSAVFDNMPDEFNELLDHCGVELDEISLQVSPTMTVTSEELSVIAGSIARPVSATIANIIGVIAVFFASVILISLLGVLLKLIVKVPVIKSINSFFGMILGAIEGFFIIWVVCLLIGLFVEQGFMSNINNEFLCTMTESSCLLKFFCQLSPIDFINIRIE